MTSGRWAARSSSASRSPGSATPGTERVVATTAGRHRDPQRDRVRRAPVGPPADDRGARRRADHPVPWRLLLAAAGGAPPRPRPDLPGPGPPVPVPRGPPDPAHRRRGVGGSERRARLRARGLPSSGREPAGPRRRRLVPRLLEAGPTPLANRRMPSSGGTIARPRSWPRSSATFPPSRATTSRSGRAGSAVRPSRGRATWSTTSCSIRRRRSSTSATRRHPPRPRRSRSATTSPRWPWTSSGCA